MPPEYCLTQTINGPLTTPAATADAASTQEVARMRFDLSWPTAGIFLYVSCRL
jgi:hypothetical protein